MPQPRPVRGGAGRTDAAGFEYPASGQWDAGWQPTPADLNGDGKADLFLLNTAGTYVSALSRATGGFDYVAGQGPAGFSAVAGDFNHDGRGDVFLYASATGD